MSLKNTLATSERIIPIEEKFFRFRSNADHGSIMIPLKNIVQIDDKGDKVKYEFITIVSDIVPRFDKGDTLAVDAMVACWNLVSTTANSDTKLVEQADFLMKRFEQALTENKRFHWIHADEWPYPLDGAQVYPVMKSWIVTS